MPRVETDDGYAIELCDCGGFTVFAPSGSPFAWAADMHQAELKIAREAEERLFG